MQIENNVQSEQTEQSVSVDNNASGDVVFRDKPKKNLGVILGMVFLAILAAGGIGFGVWAMMDGNQQKANYDKQVADLKKQNSDLLEKRDVVDSDASTNEPVSESVDKNMAQNLITPYIGSFNYLSNVFDYDYSDDVKVEIAYNNLRSYKIMDGYVYYSDLNDKYNDLFGGELGKRDYSVGHSDSFTFEGGDIERFKILEYAGGGTGLGMFSVVKNAYYDDGKLVVEVYHDVIPMCGVDGSDYCLESDKGGGGAVVESFEGSNLGDLVSKFEDKIPVYKMIFAKDNGHYILNNVVKI